MSRRTLHQRIDSLLGATLLAALVVAGVSGCNLFKNGPFDEDESPIASPPGEPREDPRQTPSPDDDDDSPDESEDDSPSLGTAESPFPCESPEPMVFEGWDTGFEYCGGGFVHRRQVGACSDPSTAPAPIDNECVSDSDCDTEEICACTGTSPVGQCVRSECQADASCQGDLLCVSTAWWFCYERHSDVYRCQEEGDTCAADFECDPDAGEGCSYGHCGGADCEVSLPLFRDGTPRAA